MLLTKKKKKISFPSIPTHCKQNKKPKKGKQSLPERTVRRGPFPVINAVTHGINTYACPKKKWEHVLHTALHYVTMLNGVSFFHSSGHASNIRLF